MHNRFKYRRSYLFGIRRFNFAKERKNLLHYIIYNFLLNLLISYEI